MTAPDRSRHIKMILDPRGPSTHATEIFLRVDLKSGLIEGRTDEPIEVHGRADYWGSAGG